MENRKKGKIINGRKNRQTPEAGIESALALVPNGQTRATTLLRRSGVAEVRGEAARPTSESLAGAQRLVGEMLSLGYLPTASLIEELQQASAAGLLEFERSTIAAMRELRGDQPSLPQLRNFADNQVASSAQAMLERIALFFGFGTPKGVEAPVSDGGCALKVQTTSAMPGTYGPGIDQESRGCAAGKLSMAVQGACSICHFRVGDQAQLMELALADRSRAGDRPLPSRGVDLAPSGGALRSLAREAAGKLGSSLAALSDAERIDLINLIGISLDGVKEDELQGAAMETAKEAMRGGLPQREARALMVGTLMRASSEPGETLTAISKAIGGMLPTDVLRAIDVMGGGDGTLSASKLPQESAIRGSSEGRKRALRIRVPRMSRRTRRAICSALEDSFSELAGQGEHGQTLAWEALSGNAEAFKHLARDLHVHEGRARWPRLGAAMALLSSEGDANLIGDERHQSLARELAGMTPGEADRARTLMSGVEQAMAQGDVATAAALLERRPGMLARAIDRLLRSEAGRSGNSAPAAEAAFSRSLPKLNMNLMVSLHGHFGRRDKPDATRSYRSRGERATRQLNDTRTPLGRRMIVRLQSAIEAEVIRRAGTLEKFDVLHVDPDLLGVRLSASSRHASSGQEGLAMGTRMRLTPQGSEPARIARLFMHWAQKGSSVDLDLSATVHDKDGKQIAVCSFHDLRDFGMVHSGDLRNAPLPTGATEYIDIDLEKVRSKGGVTVLAHVNSYTEVPFSQLARATCGVMSRTKIDADDREFDPQTVSTKFDVVSESNSKILCALDLSTPGAERIISLDIEDDKKGYGLAINNRLTDLALAAAGNGQGFPISLLIGAHATRADELRCGSLSWRQGAGESALEYALRIQGDLERIELGELDANESSSPKRSAGREMHVVSTSLHALPEGSWLIEAQAGATQPAGVERHSLRWLIDSLSRVV